MSYAIGVPEPLSVFVDTYGTGKIADSEILSKGGCRETRGLRSLDGVVCSGHFASATPAQAPNVLPCPGWPPLPFFCSQGHL